MSGSADVRRKKRVVGAVAVVLVSILFVLWFFGEFNIIIFLILALAVSLVANYIFRRLDRQANR